MKILTNLIPFHHIVPNLIFFFLIVCRKWEEQHAINGPTFPSFLDWIFGAMRAKDINPNNPNDHDLMLCIKPRLSTIRFAKAKAYGNHFHVLDHKTHLLQTFDNLVLLLCSNDLMLMQKLFI
jgi:hypothetical protein